MGSHYTVKVCINQRFDHYSSGRELYNEIFNRVSQPTFNPFDEWWQHKFISHKWDLKRHKINSITLLFIKRTHTTRQIKYIITFKIKNFKVIKRLAIKPYLAFIKDKDCKFENQYYDLHHTNMVK